MAWAEAQVQEYNARPHRSLPKIVDPVTGKRRHQTPDEAWAEHVAAGWAPTTVSEAEITDLFRPYEERTTARGEVSIGGNRYFHPALEDHHGARVLVGFDIHDPGRVWVRDSRMRLIAVAGLDANVTPAFPKSFVEQARDQRLKGQLQRLENRAHEKIAQHGGYEVRPDVEPTAPTVREIEVRAELAAEAAPARIETRKDRYLRAVALLEAAPAIAEADASWLAVYGRSREFLSTEEWVREHGIEVLDTLT
jgi:putative transposase